MMVFSNLEGAGLSKIASGSFEVTCTSIVKPFVDLTFSQAKLSREPLLALRVVLRITLKLGFQYLLLGVRLGLVWSALTSFTLATAWASHFNKTGMCCVCHHRSLREMILVKV